MLIYKNDGKLYSISQNAIKLAGYNDVSEFLAEHKDFSELFIKRPGYIYDFENFSWISFLRNANAEQKKVLILTKDNLTYECDLVLETLYPVEYQEGAPEFFYQIELKNMRRFNSSDAPYEPDTTFSTIAIKEENSIDDISSKSETETFAFLSDIEEKEASEKSFTQSTSSPFETIESTDEALTEFSQIKEEQEENQDEKLTMDFSSLYEEEATPSSPEEKPLDMIDFTLNDNHDTTSQETFSVPQSEPFETAIDQTTTQTDDLFLDTSLTSPDPFKEEHQSDALSSTPSIVFDTPDIDIKEESHEESLASEVSQPPLTDPLINTQILPDIAKISSMLGLPEDVVRTFIQEFIQTYQHDALEINAAIKAGHLHVVKKEAIKLKGVAENLLLEPLTQTLQEILTSKEEEDGKERIQQAWKSVESYMQTLTQHFATPTQTEPTPLSLQNNIPKKRLELLEIDDGEKILFNPSEAANALGLPESLIIEFVHDFIKQAREEKTNFIQAFENKDLQTINEIAHKLKGVAANLRIEDMYELMEHLQHATSVEEVEGHLVAFYRKLAAIDKTMAKEYS